MTKKEMFAEIIAMANGNEVTATVEEIVEFAEHEIELLSRKGSGSRKPTKTQQENEVFKGYILEILAEHDCPMTISEMCEDDRLSGLANQRVSALVTQLKKAEQVVRTTDKKKAYFSIAEGESEEA